MLETSRQQKAFAHALKTGERSSDCPTCDSCQEKVPSLVDKFQSLREARKQWAEAGYQLVKPSEWRRRFSVCKKCDRLIRGQCLECGCFMRIKSLLAGMTCKLGLW